MFVQDRDAARRMFIGAWRKRQAGEVLEPLEALIADVVALHPEYHAALTSGEAAIALEYTPEHGTTNPFLHMGMHIALREQVGTDRPAGIAELYRRAVERRGDPHAVEHDMMECLGEVLWRAQRDNAVPDEAAYFECLNRRLSR
ncbi:MAG: DUF1841 family protein [Gammaproteobacteria bacterium]|nr:DUF1841 family protein [Gammaproteobacteria bacterium]MCG3143908.1 hypothetical protein [Gammaproteobacteria bacterium]